MPVTRKEWIAALRSGEYKQTQGVLKSEEGGHCCIGVVCELAGLDLLAIRQKKESLHQDGDYRYGNPLATHDFRAVDAGELYAQVGTTEEINRAFAWANDKGRTFEEIADALEGDTAAALRSWGWDMVLEEGGEGA